MLSFIRKRFPSKDRSNEHLQNVKTNHIQHEYHDNDNDEMKRTKSSNELHIDKKKYKKKKNKKTSSTVDGLALASNTSPTVNRINQSYSDVDYFTMMPGALSRASKHEKISTNPEDSSLSDCYLNPTECMQTAIIKPQVFEIPVIDCRKDQQLLNYKDVDHQRTKAFREITEQRTQERSMK